MEPILTGFLSLVFGIVVLLLRQLVSDLKKVSTDINEVKSTTKLIKAEFDGSNALLNQRVQFLDSRMSRIENNLFTKQD